MSMPNFNFRDILRFAFLAGGTINAQQTHVKRQITKTPVFRKIRAMVGNYTFRA